MLFLTGQRIFSSNLYLSDFHASNWSMKILTPIKFLFFGLYSKLGALLVHISNHYYVQVLIYVMYT